MNPGTFQAKESTETDGGPLWLLHSTIGTLVIARQRLDNLLVHG